MREEGREGGKKGGVEEQWRATKARILKLISLVPSLFSFQQHKSGL